MTEDEVLARVNASPYGLDAQVFTDNLHTAHRVSARLNVGTVWVNCFFIRDLRAPFGGVGHSGVGREGGNFSREFFTEPKAIVMQINGAPTALRGPAMSEPSNMEYVVRQSSLTYAGARRVLDAAVAKATDLGVAVNVSVCDAAGHQVAFARMDGAALLAGSIATDKAYLRGGVPGATHQRLGRHARTELRPARRHRPS